ncbi:hypothetical protein OQA88_5212 [Cercophora sp. LCS_1]
MTGKIPNTTPERIKVRVIINSDGTLTHTTLPPPADWVIPEAYRTKSMHPLLARYFCMPNESSLKPPIPTRDLHDASHPHFNRRIKYSQPNLTFISNTYSRLTPYDPWEITHCHNALLSYRNGKGNKVTGVELSCLIRRVLQVPCHFSAGCKPSQFNDLPRGSVTVVCPSETLLWPRRPFQMPENRFDGEDMAETANRKKAGKDVIKNGLLKANFSVHLVTFTMQPKWNAIVRHAESGDVWYFDSGDVAGRENRFRAAETELGAWLVEQGIEVGEHTAAYMNVAEHEERPEESGLLVIAHLLAFFSCGLVGWEQIPARKREPRAVAKGVLESLHNIMGLKFARR